MVYNFKGHRQDLRSRGLPVGEVALLLFQNLSLFLFVVILRWLRKVTNAGVRFNLVVLIVRVFELNFVIIILSGLFILLWNMLRPESDRVKGLAKVLILCQNIQQIGNWFSELGVLVRVGFSCIFHDEFEVFNLFDSRIIMLNNERNKIGQS